MLNITRFDVLEAHYCLESDYNISGVLQERRSNQRRSMSTGYQLHRMGFKPRPNLSFDTLTLEGKAVYLRAILTMNINPPTVFNGVTMEFDRDVNTTLEKHGFKVGDNVFFTTYTPHITNAKVIGFSSYGSYMYISVQYDHKHAVITACSMTSKEWYTIRYGKVNHALCNQANPY